jgi:hypothetical protein
MGQRQISLDIPLELWRDVFIVRFVELGGHTVLALRPFDQLIRCDASTRCPAPIVDNALA